ncbi:MAG TPA: glycosyltransferase family 4 protein [Miltoncostaeaceae bacterium]|nr:glycosyltransferase family 4 protein [Miltoncostaeaceae bacterium]
MSTRVAVVVQRYGLEVQGGAEAQARHVAEALAESMHVEVITTCALDYATWADHYRAGAQDVNGVRVLRFPVAAPRDAAGFERATRAAYAAPHDEALGLAWMRAQGPDAPGLTAHLAERGRDYDAVVLVTYLYATTALTIGSVADRALLIPELHDEPPLRLSVFDRVFAAARLVLFNTPEERALGARRFGVDDARARVVGLGVDPPPPTDPERLRRAHGIARPYALCVGRLDPSKGTDALVADHARYRAASPEGLDLVLAGSGELALPEHPWLHRLGVVSEQEKHDALAGAAVVVLPSPYESLSIVQLEAWSHGRPTLANAASPVLVGQSRRCGGGLWYADADEYAVMLDYLARTPVLADAIGRQAHRAAGEAHSWDRVRRQWRDAVAEVAAGRAPAA